jgi:uncharacterized protein YoxC
MDIVWLFAQGRTLPDTVVMRMVPPDPSWFQQITGVASGITSLVPYALAIGLIYVAVKLRSSFDETKTALTSSKQDLKDLADAANRMAQDVAAVAEMVRTDVAKVHDTVDYTNRRARHAVSNLADRVDSFTATIEAVQTETQDVIISGLAALRGVRAGVAALRKKPTSRRHPALDDDRDDPPARPRLRRRPRAD